MKVVHYIGNDGETCALVFNDSTIQPEFYNCPVREGQLIDPPPGRLTPLVAVTLPGNPSAEEIARHRMYAIPGGHVYRHMPIRSVKIYRNGSIVANPDGFPDVPEEEDSDEVPIAAGRRAHKGAVAVPGVAAQQQQQRPEALTYFDYESRKPPGYTNDSILERINWNLPLTPDFMRYSTFGTVWAQPKMESTGISYVETRNQQTDLHKHMTERYGLYPPKFKTTTLTPKEKRINERSVKGLEGVCVYDQFPTCADVCYSHGCMEGVAARTQDPLVCRLITLLSNMSISLLRCFLPGTSLKTGASVLHQQGYS
jgi:hypothetical protein